jgi:hypothetical protein
LLQWPAGYHGTLAVTTDTTDGVTYWTTTSSAATGNGAQVSTEQLQVIAGVHADNSTVLLEGEVSHLPVLTSTSVHSDAVECLHLRCATTPELCSLQPSRAVGAALVSNSI